LGPLGAAPAGRVAGRIVRAQVRLGLDDPAGAVPAAHGRDQNAPQKIARDPFGIAREKLLRKRRRLHSSLSLFLPRRRASRLVRLRGFLGGSSAGGSSTCGGASGLCAGSSSTTPTMGTCAAPGLAPRPR